MPTHARNAHVASLVSGYADAPTGALSVIVVIGASGMLGHQLVDSLKDSADVLAVCRAADRLPDGVRGEAVDARHESGLAALFAHHRPAVVINAAGVIKHRQTSAEEMIEANAVLPHRLVRLCAAHGARLVHISTDCVFSGQRGNYTEGDPPDPDDLYGRSKLLGEVTGPNVVTLRTSMIGLERARFLGLVEWFLAQRGPIKGFTRAIFSGLTTLELARVIRRVIEHPTLEGLWHVAAQPVSKYDLLTELGKRLPGSAPPIAPDDGLQCDRSLDGRRFSRATGYVAPAWDVMLGELADQIRRRDTLDAGMRVHARG